MTIFWKYRNLIGASFFLIALAALLVSWHSRGQVIDVLRAEAKASQARYLADREVCSMLADQLRGQEESVQQALADSTTHQAAVDASLRSLRHAITSYQRRIDKTVADTSRAIVEASGNCPEQVNALAAGLVEVIE